MPMEKRHACKKTGFCYILTFVVSCLLLGSRYALASWVTQTSDRSHTGTFAKKHSQYLGTGVAGIDLTEVTFYVTGGSEYPTGTGGSGLSFKCYDNANKTSIQTCYWTSTVWFQYITNLSTLHVTSNFSGGGFPADPSIKYAVRYVSSAPLDFQTGDYDYMTYNVYSGSYPFSMLGSNTGSGAEVCVSDCTDSAYPAVQNTDDSIKSWAFCLNGDVDCGMDIYPTLIVSGSEAVDVLNQKVLIDLSGDFITVGSGYSGYIQIQKICERVGYPLIKTGLTDVHIRVYATCETETTTIGEGFYYGYKYCDDPADTHWKADRIALPYPANYSCTYPVEFCVYDEHGQPIQCVGDTINLSTVTSGSQYNVDEPPKSDPIAWLGWKIGQVLTALFSFNNIDTNQFNILKANIDTHAPFSYATTIFGSDWSSPVTSGSAMPSLSFTFATGGSYNYIPDVSVSGVLATIRPVLVILLWFGLITYIIFRVRELAHSL